VKKQITALNIALCALLIPLSTAFSVRAAEENAAPEAPVQDAIPDDAAKEEEETTSADPQFIEGSTFSGKPAYDESLGGFVYEPYEDGGYIITGYNEIERNVSIPETIGEIKVTAIGETAFYGKDNILSVTIPDTVTYIGRDAFGDCKKLASVRLPASLRTIEADAFRGCDMLREITLPEGLESIGDSAFEGCARIGRLKAPSSLREIGIDAFLSCESLILECGGNAYAEDYAAKNSIPTSFTDTGTFQLVICAVMAAILLCAVVIVRKVMKKSRAK